MQRQEQALQHNMQQQPSSLSNKISEHDVGPLSDYYNPLQPQQQPSFQSNRPTMTPVPYDSGNIESPALPPTDKGTFTATTTLGRRPSLVEGLLTSAATAASTAVEAARSLVSHEDILEEEAKDIKDPSSSSTASTSLFPSLGPESHHGLEFKQQRLFGDKSKKEVPATTATTTTTTQKAPQLAKASVAPSSPPVGCFYCLCFAFARSFSNPRQKNYFRSPRSICISFSAAAL